MIGPNQRYHTCWGTFWMVKTWLLNVQIVIFSHWNWGFMWPKLILNYTSCDIIMMSLFVQFFGWWRIEQVKSWLVYSSKLANNNFPRQKTQTTLCGLSNQAWFFLLDDIISKTCVAITVFSLVNPLDPNLIWQTTEG